MSWLRGACTSCERAPASERGAWTSWLLAVCVSIAFADATSGGQEVCAIPTVAEREKTVTTLIVAASNFLIVVSVLSDCVLTAFSTGDLQTYLVFSFNMLWPVPSPGPRHDKGVLPGMPPTDDPANCLGLWYRVAAMSPSIGRCAVGVCAITFLLYTLGGCTTAPPAPGSRQGLPAPIREVLPNGMRLIIQEHRAAATVAIHLWTGVGGRVEAVGGRTNAGTSNDYTFYYLLLPATRTAQGISTIADMVLNSVFDATELARERDVVFE